MKFPQATLAGILALLSISSARPGPAPGPASLVGTWTLKAADVAHPDGTRTQDYGPAPRGLLMVDAGGRYSLQIFRGDRPRFAAGDRAKGTPEEYAGTVLSMSTHFGSVSVDPAAHRLTFRIEAASFPNQDGSVQSRAYELSADELSYRVEPRPNGDVPVSVWRRVR